jgi:hypothetical protein
MRRAARCSTHATGSGLAKVSTVRFAPRPFRIASTTSGARRVNDTTFVSFDVTHTPVFGAEGEAYAAARYAQQEAEAETRWDLAHKVMAGEMKLEDLPDEMTAYTSFAIEDYVTQVGVGPIDGRTKEYFGSTDAKVVLLRRMWLREVAAMLEGRTLTEWKIPTDR